MYVSTSMNVRNTNIRFFIWNSNIRLFHPTWVFLVLGIIITGWLFYEARILHGKSSPSKNTTRHDPRACFCEKILQNFNFQMSNGSSNLSAVVLWTRFVKIGNNCIELYLSFCAVNKNTVVLATISTKFSTYYSYTKFCIRFMVTMVHAV